MGGSVQINAIFLGDIGTPVFEYGSVPYGGCYIGDFEYGRAPGIGASRNLSVKADGAWIQVVRAYQKIAGSWQPVTIRQKVAGAWIPVVT